MRRFTPLVPRRTAFVRLCLGTALAFGLALATIQAQIPGRNVNMVAGDTWPDGDPYLQRQNEPSIAASTRNPLHLLAGSNDYRTVDVPGLPGDEIGDAWLGVYKSYDGGQRWTSNLLPGYPQDESPEGMASPIKGYAAGADPVVRAGSNGLIYYAGLVFDRSLPATPDVPGKSAIFVARYIDNNNKESGNTIHYLGTRAIQKDPGGATGNFLDKPWMAVDIPRNNQRCTVVTHDPDPNPPFEDRVVTQSVPAGPIYLAYTLKSTDNQGERYDIYFSMSTNCGDGWTPPVRLNDKKDRANQGATMAIDPRNGDVHTAWRSFDLDGDEDALMTVKFDRKNSKFNAIKIARKYLKDKKKKKIDVKKFFKKGGIGKAIEAAVLSPLDQSTSDINGLLAFRTNAYPSMTIDDTGRIYLVWAERGYAAGRPSATDGDARVVISTSNNGTNWSTPVAIADETIVPPLGTQAVAARGHQLMPAITFAGGKLMVVYYDLRETRAVSFNKYIDDKTAFLDPAATGLRHTLDIRASMASPGAAPAFAHSVRVSDYLEGPMTPGGPNVPLQVNPPNLPMFKLGTAPFIGDYVDVTAAPAMVQDATGKWVFNTAPGPTAPIFHAAWTDNRDVRAPTSDHTPGGNPLFNGDNNPWNNYTPPGAGGPSKIDGAILPACVPGNAGSRNQNIYSARITGGLLVGSPGNTKDLGFRNDENGAPTAELMQRGFVVFAQNTTDEERAFRLSIPAQPIGGSASFSQFAAVTTIEAVIPPRTTASRTVYATSTDPDAKINIDVVEIVALNGVPVSNGLAGIVALNPDIDNPDIDNPDIDNPDIDNPDIDNPDIDNAEVRNPDIDNPDIDNPDIDNPDIDNPDIDNPDIDNIRVANPDIDNPDIDNPDIDNPDIDNPDIDNPDIDNPDIDNASLMTDVSWSITNRGNTTAAYNVNLFFAQTTFKPTIETQLILYRTYKTPVVKDCALKSETQNVLVANVPNPQLVKSSTGEVSNPNDSAPTNATIYLAPGESAKITLRVFDPNPEPGSTVEVTNADGSTAIVPTSFVPNEDVTPVIQQQSVDTPAVDAGDTEPPVVVQFPAPQTVPDTVSTAPMTPVTINVLGNDSTAFGSTKVQSLHPAGMATHSGGGPGDITFQPASGFLYTQRGAVDPVTNALVGRFGLPPSGFGIASHQANPRTGINYGRAGGPTGSLTALDARPGSGTYHQYLPMPALTSILVASAFDAVNHRLYALHSTSTTNTVVATTTVTAIDIDPGSTRFHQILWETVLPGVNVRGSGIGVNSRTQKVYVAAGNADGGVFVLNAPSATPPVGPPALKLPNTFGGNGVAINESANLAYVSSSAGGNTFQLHVIDGATNAMTTVGTGLPMRGGNNDERLVVHEASGRVVMRLETQAVIIDTLRGSTTRNTVVGVINGLGRDAGTDIAIDQELGLAITVGGFDFRVDVIDVVAGGLVGGPFPLNFGPSDVAIDPVNHRAFISVPLTYVQELSLSPLAMELAKTAVFVESGGLVLNPTTNKAYTGLQAVTAGIGKMSGAGYAGLIPGVPTQGRYLFSDRHDLTNRFFIVNSGNADGTGSDPGGVAVIDGATDAYLGMLDTKPNPFGIGVNQATGKVYVASLNSPLGPGGIEIGNANDLEQDAVLADLSAVPLIPQGGALSFGRYVVINPANNKAYVLQSNATASLVSLVAIDGTTNVATPLDGVVGSPLYDAAQTAAAGTETWGRVEVVRANAAKNRLYLGMFDSVTNTVRIVSLDLATNAVASWIGGGHSQRHTPSYLNVNPAGTRLYVVDYNNDHVTMLDADTMAPIGTPTALPDGPSATAFNALANRLYVSSLGAKALTALDGDTLAVQSSVRLPLVAHFLAVDEVESRLYTSGGDSADESGIMVVTDILGQLGTNVSVTGVTATANGGTAILNDDYSVTYTPPDSNVTSDSFGYTIAAPSGTATGTVTINIVESNPVSVAFSDGYSTVAGQLLTVPAPGPLANDAPGGPATMVVATNPVPAGTLTPQADGSFTYQPLVGFTGVDVFEYHTVGPLGSSNTARVAITVTTPVDIAVTTTANTGPGSLRQAIINANLEANSTIRFAITGAGPHLIQPATPLPQITSPMLINGYSQLGAAENTSVTGGTNAVMGVEIRGVAGNNSIGLNVVSGGVTIRGLAINNHTNTGILLDGPSGGSKIEGSFIGTTATGAAATSNNTGIVSQSPGNTIGGTSLAARNLISGNSVGVSVRARTSTNTVVHAGSGTEIINNLIGINATGTAAHPNTSGGVQVSVPDVTIGGLAADRRNIISGNGQAGISTSATTYDADNLGPGNNGPIAPVFVEAPSRLVVQGNYIGTDAAGTGAVANTNNGVIVTGEGSVIGGANPTPGGPCTAPCNLIAGNSNTGLSVTNSFDNTSGVLFSSAEGTSVAGNYIGVRVGGTIALPNTGTGLQVNAPEVTVANNVVAGNGSVGISFGASTVPTGAAVAGANASGSSARGNYVGLNAAGTALLPNTQSGIFVAVPAVTLGGSNPGDGNYVVGNMVPPTQLNPAISVDRQSSGAGVVAVADGTIIQGNVVGLFTNGARTSSRGSGISIRTSGNHIVGNTIAGLGNGSAPFAAALSISGSGAPANGNFVKGNLFGTNALSASGLGSFGAAISIFASSNNTIGGTTAADRNVIVAHTDFALFLSGGTTTASNNNIVTGNYIGVMADGQTAAGNTGGIQISTVGAAIADRNIIGGSTAGERNVMASTGLGNAITLFGAGTTNTVIRGNYIGVAADGSTARGNAGGIMIQDANGSSIGGPVAADGNLIANNTGAGVTVTNLSGSAVRNSILGNRISANTGGGIDLGANGTTNNDTGDTDSGPNNLQNYPVLLSAANGGGTTAVEADFSSFAAPVGTYTVQFFASATCDANGNSRGERLAGSFSGVTGSGVQTFQLTPALAAGEYVTATATDANGNTSELSPCYLQADVAPAQVTNTSDSGSGSLRGAITYANMAPGAQTITFDIPGAGPHTIQPTSMLPVISGPTIINGYSQTGAVANSLGAGAGTNAVMKIVINGANAAGAWAGLSIGGGNVTIRGLVINGYNAPGAAGLLVDSPAGSDTIAGNFIGTDVTGMVAVPNRNGIVLHSPSSTIGGTALADRNLVSGNTFMGIRVEASTNNATVFYTASGSSVRNNLVGTNAAGTQALPNSEGIQVSVPNVTIGGTTAAARNVISGNGGFGINSFATTFGQTFITQPIGLTIQGNYVGTTADGLGALGNGSSGINVNGPSVIGGATGTTPTAGCAGACNLVSGNSHGISVNHHYDNSTGAVFSSATGTTILGNYVGLNVNGTGPLPNLHVGISASARVVIGDGTAAGRNVVAGNVDTGISLGNSYVLANSQFVGNADNSVIRGNWVGFNAAGTAAIVNSNNAITASVSGLQIGGPLASDGNALITGGAAFPYSAISLFRTTNGSTPINAGGTALIQNNFIGTNAGTIASNPPGTVRMNTVGHGLSIGTAGNQILNNVIAGNGVDPGTSSGIGIYGGFATGNIVKGNFIGTNAAGGDNLGNTGSGINISDASGNTIGGATLGERNVIVRSYYAGLSINAQDGQLANNNTVLNNYIGVEPDGTTIAANAGGGIWINANSSGGINNTTIGQPGAGNVIAGNTSTGIALNGTGVTNASILSNSIYGNSYMGIDLNAGANGGTVPPVVSNATNLSGTETRIDVSVGAGSYTVQFFTAANCSSNSGQGQTFLGSATVNTPGQSGILLNTLVPPGSFITATGTSISGNTSEFAACVEVDPNPLIVTNTNNSGNSSLRNAITYANATLGHQTITFNIQGVNSGNPGVINVTGTPLPAITETVTINATVQPGWDGQPVIELNGGNTISTGLQTATDVSGVTVRGLAITRFTDAGIEFLQHEGGPGNTINQNTIGTDRLGTAGKGNGAGIRLRTDSSSIINNVISGNTNMGVLLNNDADSVVISNNKIGTNIDGSSPLANGGNGISMYDSLNDIVIENNAISGNLGWGIEIDDTLAGDVTNTRIRHNTIGGAFGNSLGGVRINNAPGTGFGAPGPVQTITGNGGTGVMITTGTANFAGSGNRIFLNGGLGIDKGAPGPTGPFAGVNSAINNGGNTAVDVDLSFLPVGNYQVDFYASVTCDPSNHGEGERWVGTAPLMQPGGSASMNEVVPAGQFITTVATDTSNSSTEFSGCRVVTNPPPPATITSATPSTIAVGGAGQMIWLYGANLPGAGPTDIIIKSGTTDYPAQYTWTAGSNLVIARFTAAVPPGPATIRVKAPGGSPVSNEFNITISTTPSAPIATGVYGGSCGGFGGPGSITATTQGGGVVVGAKGIDTTGVRFKWTPLNGGSPQSVNASSACGGPNDDVHVQSTVPVAYGPGTVLRLEITTTVNGIESAVSNSFTLTVEDAALLAGSVSTGADPTFPAMNTMVGWATTRITGNYNVGGLSLVAAHASQLEYPMGTTGEYQYAAAGFAGPDTSFAMACPAGKVFTGVTGTHSSANAILSLGAECKAPDALAGGVTATTGPVGTSPGFLTFGISCPAGTKMVGFQGQAGGHISGLGIICR